MISENDVRYIAGLARIHLEDEEVPPLTKDLEAILGYITKLEKLDVTDIEPTSHALPMKNVYREDEVKASLSHEEALKIAVEKENGAFKVPKVIE